MKTRMQEGIENRAARERNAALRDQADAMHRRARAEERKASALEVIAAQLATLTARVDALESNQDRDPAKDPHCLACNGETIPGGAVAHTCDPGQRKWGPDHPAYDEMGQ